MLHAHASPSPQPWPATAVLITAIVYALTLSASVLLPAFAALAVWALRSPRHAIQSLSLVWMLGLLNPDLLATDLRAVWQWDHSLLLLKWAVLLAAAGSCVIRVIARQEPVPRPVVWIGLFAGSTCVASFATSGLPDVSVTKLVSFWLGATTVVLGFHLSRTEAAQHQQWFAALAAVLVVLNLPLLFVPSMYRYQDHLFRGLFSHPQVTGLVTAIIFAWIAGQCLSDHRISVIRLLLALGAFAVLWPTGSRTAVFALGLAFAAALALQWAVVRPSLRQVATVVARSRIAVLALLAAMAVAAAGSEIADRWTQFVEKRPTGMVGASPELWSSREFMVRVQWRNFQQKPWFGNGFGVPSRGGPVHLVRDPATGVALSLATEKGFLPTAVLEETGILGATLLLAAVTSLLGRIARGAQFPQTWFACTALFVNLGESVFFSFGGLGMFLWVMLGFATVANAPAAMR